MSNQKISDFAITSTVLDADYYPVISGGSNKRISGANLKTVLGTAALAAIGYTPMRGSNNLRELTNASTARTALGLGTMANQPANSSTITTALGFTPLRPSNNLSELADAATSRSNLGLGSIATQSASAVSISGGSLGAMTGSPSFTGTVTAAAFVGSGAGLTGIGSGTGGVINTGSTTIGADSDSNGVGVIDLQTRTVTRLRIANTGALQVQGRGGDLWSPFQLVYYAEEYDSLGDAIDDIGDENKATLIVSTTQVLTDDVTSSANITLVCQGNAYFSGAHTLAIQGPFYSEPVQRFDIATTVDVSENDSLRELWVEWWGAIGGVEECADELDAAIAAWPNGTTMRFGSRASYNVSHGVTIDHKFQCTLLGNDGREGYADPGTQPIIVYEGEDGGVAVTLSNTYACTYRGFAVYGNNGEDNEAGADIGILNTFESGGFPGLSSHNHFVAVRVNAQNIREDWVCLQFSNPNNANNEQHVVENCLFVGGQQGTAGDRTGIGVIQAHTQVKAVRYVRNTYIGLHVGIQATGNFESLRGVYSGVDLPYEFIFMLESTYISGDDIEGALQWFSGGDCNGLIQFDSCRLGSVVNYGASTGAPVINVVSPHELSFKNCFFMVTVPSGEVAGPYFVYSANAGGTLQFDNCRWLTNSSQTIDPKTLGAGFVTAGNTTVTNGRITTSFGGASPYDEGSGQRMESNPGSYHAVRRTLYLSGKNLIVESNVDGLFIGDGSIGVAGLFMPGKPRISVVGTTGSTDRRFTIIAVDSAGRRSLSFSDSGDRFVRVTNSNATLTGSNYISLNWPAQVPIPDHFEVWEVNPSDSGQWRHVDDVDPSGTPFESYHVVANPSGSFVSTRPTFNEAGFINLRNSVVYPNEVTLPANDTTPSVAIANDFVTSNSSTTTYAGFDDGTTGKKIRNRIADANSKIANNGSIATGTGADIDPAVNGAVYEFIFRGGAWRRVL